MAKEEVPRGTRKRFWTTVTDLAKILQDPDECYVRLEKTGIYTYGSPTRWFTCSKIGTKGQWGADITIPNYMTLGDWLVRFRWRIASVWDSDVFECTIIRKDKPWTHTPEAKVI